VTLLADGHTAEFTPASGYFGPAGFGFVVTDPANGLGTAGGVSVQVVPVAPDISIPSGGDAPDEDTPVTIPGVVPDAPSGGGDLRIIGTPEPAHGSVVIGDNGTPYYTGDDYFLYTPSADWSGTDTFTYWLGDDFGDVVPGAITVTIRPVNDPPVARLGSATTPQNTPVDVDLWALTSDKETAPEDMTFTVANALHGSVILLADGHTARFTPDADYHGPAHFTYTTTDTGDGPSPAFSASSTVTVTVNSAPAAGDASVSYHVVAGQPLVVYPSSSDADADDLTRTVLTQPAHGTVAWDDAYGGFVYTNSDPTFIGVETFTYRVSDGYGGTATGTVTITLTNEPPEGDADVEMSASAQGPVYIGPDVWDPDNDDLTVTSVTQPSAGSVSPDASGAGVTYFPPSGFTGTVTFSYTVCDGHGGTLTINVSITITDDGMGGGGGGGA
jgi:hypothetical protein